MLSLFHHIAHSISRTGSSAREKKCQTLVCTEHTQTSFMALVGHAIEPASTKLRIGLALHGIVWTTQAQQQCFFRMCDRHFAQKQGSDQHHLQHVDWTCMFLATNMSATMHCCANTRTSIIQQIVAKLHQQSLPG